MKLEMHIQVHDLPSRNIEYLGQREGHKPNSVSRLQHLPERTTGYPSRLAVVSDGIDQ